MYEASVTVKNNKVNKRTEEKEVSGGEKAETEPWQRALWFKGRDQACE